MQNGLAAGAFADKPVNVINQSSVELTGRSLFCDMDVLFLIYTSREKHNPECCRSEDSQKHQEHPQRAPAGLSVLVKRETKYP